MKKFVAIALFALLVVSCAKEREAPEGTAKPVTSKEYLARVNGVAIDAEDVKEEFNMLSLRAQQLFMTEGGLENLLDELIKKEMLYQEAAKRNYESDQEFKRLMEDYRKRLLIGFLLKNEVEDKSEVSDAEVRKYYDDNRDDFVLEAPGNGKPEALEFGAVKELIRQRLSEQKKDKIFEDYIAGLRKSYDVEINKDAVGRAFGNMTAPEVETAKP